MLPRLLLLTDRSQLRLSQPLADTLAQCVAAGATHVVVRELDELPRARAALVDVVVEAGGTAIAAHDALPGASGVHLPMAGFRSTAADPDAPGPSEASRAIGLRGASCHSAAEVREAAGLGATYATLSPYAATASKPGYGPALGPDAFTGHPIPVFALGGIDPENAAAARSAGAYGVAVMGAVMRAPDPAAVVRDLLAAVG